MSRPHVTITLGGSGQVVKRAEPDLNGPHSNHVKPMESKLSSRERLGISNDSSLNGSEQRSKRQRRNDGDGDRQLFSSTRIGRDDLRLKLIHKNSLRSSFSVENNGVDLREKLSRTAKYPLRIDAKHILERRCIPLVDDTHRHPLDSSRSSYSSRMADRLRHVSPDRNFVSRGLSPPRNLGHLRSASSMKSMDLSSSNHFRTEVAVAKRTTFITKDPVGFEAGKSAVRLPQPTGMVQKPSFVSIDPPTVTGLLHSLGLGKYCILFQAEEIDMTALKQMKDNDLKELGIPMGPRKKILLALLPPSSKFRQPRHV